MRDRIWTELTQAKFNVVFAGLYAERQRMVLRYFNISMLVFSAGGVVGWKIWDNVPFYACILIGIISLFRLVSPQLIMSEKQILNLDAISSFYFNYYNLLERLWFDNEDESMDRDSIKVTFFKIKESEADINGIVNDTLRSKPKTLISKAKVISDNYFKSTFNTYDHE
ncbi:MAG: hypothetical protein WCI31_06160 [Prolixibacteraceae bacterium]